MDLALAQRLHALAMAAEEPKKIADHTRSYHRASRCVRQTIMLRARLRRDRERHLAATPPPGRPLFADQPRIDSPEMLVEGRVMDLQEAASRIVAKASPDMVRAAREDALDRVDAWIDQEVDDDEGFCFRNLDDHVLSLCRAACLPEDLGRRFRELRRAPREDEGEFSGSYCFASPRRDTG